MEYISENAENIRANIAIHMMPTLYKQIKSEAVLPETKLRSIVCEETVKFADELMRQLGYTS